MRNKITAAYPAPGTFTVTDESPRVDLDRVTGSVKVETYHTSFRAPYYWRCIYRNAAGELFATINKEVWRVYEAWDNTYQLDAPFGFTCD